MTKKLIIIISSPSGAGKSSICKRLLKDDTNLTISISDTTRPPRDNEEDGKVKRSQWPIAWKRNILVWDCKEYQRQRLDADSGT